MVKKDKGFRMLSMYDRLVDGQVLFKSEEADRFEVNEKSIQRDIEEIREYLDEQAVQTGGRRQLIYDHRQHGYRIGQSECGMLSNEEVLAVTKILLDSRAFPRKEMMSILDRLLSCCVPQENQKLADELIANEKHHYIELRHKKSFLKNMWEIGIAIQKKRYIEIAYERGSDYKVVNRKVQPLAIMFSEYYFYLAAHIENIDRETEFENANDKFPTIYRIDRIQKLEMLKEQFKIPYRNRFEEGEYRKRIQFMQGGRMQRTKFWYHGINAEAVLDRLPTAQILKEEDGKFLIVAETFGKGIDMWLRSQGDRIEIVQN